MMYKALIGTLALCTISACIDNGEPIAESGESAISSGAFAGHNCRYKADSNSSLNDDARLRFTVRTKRNTSQAQPDFKMFGDPSRYHKGHALYQVDIYYHTVEPNPDEPGSNIKQNVFEYKNIDFEYDNEDLILKIPQDNNVPDCQIRFKKDDEIGEHICESENNEMGYRAATFKLTCSRVGKIGAFSEPEL